MKILVKIRYDGSAYCGFQAQPNGVSVQSVLTEAFLRLFGFPCNVTGCSRTDSGVHARGFCATVEPRILPDDPESWCRIPISKIHRAVNVLLPDDIAVAAAAAVPGDFHARYNVAWKTYEYSIWNAPSRNPFLRRYAYHVPRRISEAGVETMRQTAALFVGRHDFAGYMASGSKIVDTVRTVHEAEIQVEENKIIYRVSADGFLYNMVRIMAGTLLDCACGRKTLFDAKRALEEGDRTAAGFTAPGYGLFLSEVEYDRAIHWECE